MKLGSCWQGSLATLPGSPTLLLLHTGLWEHVQGVAEQQDHEGTLLRLTALAQQSSHSLHWVLGAAGGGTVLALCLKAQRNETFETLITRTTGLLWGWKYVLLKLLQY